MKNLILMFLIGGVLLLLATSCSTKATGQSPSASNDKTASAYHKLTAAEAKEMIDDGAPAIVDVRTAAEYAERHIPGAILIPNETIQKTPPKELADFNASIIVYCRTGVRSKQAANKLVAMGYTRIYDVGGITTWPYETVSGTGE